jgi:predicted anti-sigma-YlaC factor YlaD
MKCEEIHHFIDTYLDAELDLARQVELGQHLANCPSCRSLLEERRAFRTLFVAAVREYKAPPQLEAKVWLQCAGRQHGKSFPSGGSLGFTPQPWWQ